MRKTGQEPEEAGEGPSDSEAGIREAGKEGRRWADTCSTAVQFWGEVGQGVGDSWSPGQLPEDARVPVKKPELVTLLRSLTSRKQAWEAWHSYKCGEGTVEQRAGSDGQRRAPRLRI